MRKAFFDNLHERMKENENIFFITADLGFGLANKIKEDFPNRFVNSGASEQAAIGIAVGLRLSGKIVFVYSITPFLIWRAAEWIRNYLGHENIPVILVGSGRDSDYHEDGFSHYAGDDHKILGLFPNIQGYWPRTKEQIPEFVDMAINSKTPFYLNLKR